MIVGPAAQSRGVFVTGTDTGVGKTHVAKRLLAELRNRGVDAVGFKPVETGGDDDVRALEAEPLYVLRRPAAPAEAAEAESVSIDLEKICRRFADLTTRHQAVVVEGAGGWLVPLTRQYLMADLAARLGLPVLLVARSRLGTINHTLLTVRDIERRGVRFLGTLLNSHQADDLDADGGHARWIEQFGGRVLGRYPEGVDWASLAGSITNTR